MGKVQAEDVIKWKVKGLISEVDVMSKEIISTNEKGTKLRSKILEELNKEDSSFESTKPHIIELDVTSIKFDTLSQDIEKKVIKLGTLATLADELGIELELTEEEKSYFEKSKNIYKEETTSVYTVIEGKVDFINNEIKEEIEKTFKMASENEDRLRHLYEISKRANIDKK